MPPCFNVAPATGKKVAMRVADWWRREGDRLVQNWVFIDLPETAPLGRLERFRQQAERDGRECVRLDGNLTLIRMLLDGDWDPAHFLIVDPGRQTAGVYDWSEIIRAT